MVFYLKEGVPMQPSQFIIGFILNLLSVLIAVVILAASFNRLGSFFYRWWMVMLVAGLISIEKMMDYNWMHFSLALHLRFLS